MTQYCEYFLNYSSLNVRAILKPQGGSAGEEEEKVKIMDMIQIKEPLHLEMEVIEYLHERVVNQDI